MPSRSAGAFILGFPLSAILDAKYGLRAPLYAAAAAGLVALAALDLRRGARLFTPAEVRTGVLNFVVIALLVPESLPAPAHRMRLSASPPARRLPLRRGSRVSRPAPRRDSIYAQPTRSARVSGSSAAGHGPGRPRLAGASPPL